MKRIVKLKLALWIAGLCPLLAAAASPPVAPTVVHAFSGSAAGLAPRAAPIQAQDGYLYGTTLYGMAGSHDGWGGYGTVYRMKPDGSSFSTIYGFTGGDDGGEPNASLIQGHDGAFYGTTSNGSPTGSTANGTVFRITADGQLRTLHRFNGTDGVFVTGSLVQDAAGTLYGTAQNGGASNLGVIFSLTPDGSGFKLLYSFSGGVDGFMPIAGLTLGSDGRLYGTANQGGSNGYGTVFSIGRDGTGFKVLHAFAGGNVEGSYPMAALAAASDGGFFGTTYAGGHGCACGTVFKIDAGGALTTLHSFSGDKDGSGPSASILLASDGKLYGTTTTGGASLFYGTAFRLAIDGRLEGVVSFNDSVNQLQSGLMQASDGQLYGVGQGGGTTGMGAIYKLDPQAFPAPAPSVALTVTPARIRAGGRSALRWSATGPGLCTASGDDWNGVKPLSGAKLLAPTSAGTYAYTLSCKSAGGSTSASTTLQVLP